AHPHLAAGGWIDGEVLDEQRRAVLVQDRGSHECLRNVLFFWGHPRPRQGPPCTRAGRLILPETLAVHGSQRYLCDVRESLELTDPGALRALAHPLRIRLLGLLREDGPGTATTLARVVGESTGDTSYHL